MTMIGIVYNEDCVMEFSKQVKEAAKRDL